MPVAHWRIELGAGDVAALSRGEEITAVAIDEESESSEGSIRRESRPPRLLTRDSRPSLRESGTYLAEWTATSQWLSRSHAVSGASEAALFGLGGWGLIGAARGRLPTFPLTSQGSCGLEGVAPRSCLQAEQRSDVHGPFLRFCRTSLGRTLP